MKLTSWFVFAALLFAIMALAEPVSAAGFENDDQAPAAFVEGTRDYTIPYFEKTLAKLRMNFSEEELWMFTWAVGEVKKLNVALIERITRLRANKSFLGEKDGDLVLYRKRLAQTTDIMFGLLQKLNARSTLPPR